MFWKYNAEGCAGKSYSLSFESSFAAARIARANGAQVRRPSGSSSRRHYALLNIAMIFFIILFAGTLCDRHRIFGLNFLYLIESKIK
jgi:hypothetical protein